MVAAAMPVDAVTATFHTSMAYLAISCCVIYLRRYDFPVPAGPVMNTLLSLLLERMNAAAADCSSDNENTSFLEPILSMSLSKIR